MMMQYYQLADRDFECIYCAITIGSGESLFANVMGEVFCSSEHRSQWNLLHHLSQTYRILLLCSYGIGLRESIALTHARES